MLERPTDAELALTLGSLCLKQKLWGKAQRYLEQALSDATEARMVREAHLKLAQMHEALGQEAEAAAHWRPSCKGAPRTACRARACHPNPYTDRTRRRARPAVAVHKSGAIFDIIAPIVLPRNLRKTNA